MAISYGTITITDKTDLGQLSVYLTGSTVNQQTCDTNPEPDVYYPDWSTTALVITPHAYYNNTVLNINDFTVTWTKQENGGNVISVPKQNPDAADPETLANDGKSLVRQKNLTLNSTGVIYTATISYKPIPNDNVTIIRATATISFTITSYGVTGAAGKSLQLVGNGTYFTYTWDDSLYGNPVVNLTVQKSDIDYFGWKCDDNIIYQGNPPTISGSNRYVGTSLILAGDSSTTEGVSTVRIDHLSTYNWEHEGYAKFQIYETDSSGTPVQNGFTDFFTIYKYKEAAPGDNLYASYLDNNEEIIVTYQGIMDLSGATTRLYINEGGSSDITNWHISVGDTIQDSSQFDYVVWNSLDYPNGVYRGHSTTQITAGGTQNPTINGQVVQTSNIATNSLVSYNNNGSYLVFIWNGSAWGITTTNLTKYGPDCVAVFTFTVNTAKINFTSQRGTYDNNSFTPDPDIAALYNSFTVTKSASVIGHSLRLSAVNAKKANSTNTYEPPTIEVAAIQRSNSGVEPYTGQGSLAIVIYPKTGQATTLAPVTPPYTLTLATYGDINYIETYLGDGTTSGSGIEDRQTITITSDGASGTSPWLFTIGNPYDSISTDYSYKPTASTTYSIPLEVMHGEDQETLYHTTGSSIQYPNVTASCDVGVITLNYKYQGQAMTTSGTNAYKVDEICFTTSTSTSITSGGTITVNFYANSGAEVVERLYTYKAIPAALKPITAQIYVEPSAIFTNQTGTSIAIPDIRDGTNPIVGTSAINSYTWWVYVVGTGWRKITNNSSAVQSDEVYIEGVSVGLNNNGAWQNKINGTNESQNLKVSGSAVPGYLGFKLEAAIYVGGASTTTTYTVPINFTDINDPLQVTLHSTLGEQLVNGQGVGVIYARVIMGDVVVDEIPPDDKLGVGNTAPSNSDNTGDFEGKLGYCVFRSDNNYLIDYYERSTTSGTGSTWELRSSPTASYQWYFRDNGNEPIDPLDSNIAVNLRVLSQVNQQGERQITNQQFVYLSRDVVDKKLTADVKVEKN